MLIRLAALTLLFTGSAAAAWQRYVANDVGHWTDAPATHHLTYFRTSACPGRAPEERKADCKPKRTKLVLIGFVGKLTLYDLNYYLDNDYEPPDHVSAKSILLRSEPDVYREIYFRQSVVILDSFSPTELITMGAQRLLATYYEDGGNARYVLEEFQSLDSRGNKAMRLDGILKAAQQAVPSDVFIYYPASGTNLKTLTWTSGTEPSEVNIGRKVACCDGQVTVRLKIEGGEFVPVSAKYERVQ